MFRPSKETREQTSYTNSQKEKKKNSYGYINYTIFYRGQLHIRYRLIFRSGEVRRQYIDLGVDNSTIHIYFQII